MRGICRESSKLRAQKAPAVDKGVIAFIWNQPVETPEPDMRFARR